MKLKLNKRYVTISAYAVAVIVISGALLYFVANIPAVAGLLGGFFGLVGEFLAIAFPVILGLCIAYILNIPMSFIERRLLRLKKGEKPDILPLKQRKKARRWALAMTVVLVLVLIAGFFALVLPQLVASGMKIGEKLDELPQYFASLQQSVVDVFGENSPISSLLQNPLESLGSFVDNLWESYLEPQLLDFLAGAVNQAAGLVGGAIDILVAVVIAINVLAVKDMLLMQTRKVLFAAVKAKFCHGLFSLLGRANVIFRKYLAGLFIDAFLVGLITYLGCMLIGVQFPLLIAVIIGFTNFIPFFGPIIGAVPTTFIIFMDSPAKALLFVIFIVLLQQLDGNVLVPAIQGGATGVPNVWVLVAIMIGSGLFGVAGLLLAVPVFAVIYMLCKDWIEARLKKKKLPYSSYAYDRASDYGGYGENAPPESAHDIAPTGSPLHEGELREATPETSLMVRAARYIATKRRERAEKKAAKSIKEINQDKK